LPGTITNQLAITDNSLTPTFFDPFGHTVKVYNLVPNGTPQAAPFTCTGIGTNTDPVSQIEVQFAKI